MAYKFSVGAYQHSGSLQATVDITGSTTVSGAVGNFGTLTVASFSPANISSTNITASSNMSASTANFGTLTVGTFSPANISTTDLTVTGVTTLSGNVFLGDATADVVTVNGQITGSLFAINGGAINGTTIGATTQSSVQATTLSASSTLQVGGITTVQALSSSVGVSASVGQFGTLTVATFSPSTISTTSLTATTGSFTRVSGTFVDFLVNNKVPTWDDNSGVFSNSEIISTAGGLTSVGAGLYVTGSVSSSVGISSSVGQFGTLTVATFSPTNISATNITASTNVSASTANIGTLTVGTFSPVTLTVSGDSTLGDSVGVDKVIFNSKVSSSLFPVVSQNLGDPGGNDLWKVYASTISGSSTLQVGGISTLQAVNAQAVTATTLSASGATNIGGALTVAGAVTFNGNLTVNGTTTVVSSSTLEIGDKNVVIASGSTNSFLANGAGFTLGTTGYQLQFVSSSSGTSSDYWQFSGSVDGLTDFRAGNITATTFSGSVVESTQTVSSAGPTGISTSITFVNFGGTAIVTLPSASLNAGISYKVKNLTANAVTVKSSAGTIDGIAAGTGITLATQYAAASFASDGTNWHVF